MGSGVRGVVAGSLALVALQTLVRPGASGRVASLFGVPAKVARRFINPTVPAIPDRRENTGGGSLRQGVGEGAESPRRWPDPFRLGTPNTGA